MFFYRAMAVGIFILVAHIQINAATVYARNNGDWDQTSRWSLVGTGGTSCGCIPGIGDDVIIDGYNIDIDSNTGNVSVNSVVIRSSDRDVNSRLRIQNGMTLTTTGDLTLFGNRASRTQRLLLVNTASTVNVGGDLIIDQDDGLDAHIDIEGSGIVSITDDFIVNKDGGEDVLITLNQNNGSEAQLLIGDDFDIVANTVTNSDVQILVDDANSLLTVGGDFNASINSTGTGNDLLINMDNGDFNVTGTMTLTRTGDYGDIDIDMNGGDIDAGAITINSSGNNLGESDVFIYIDDASNITVTNDMIATMTGGGDVDLSINWTSGTQGTLDVGGDLTFNRTAGEIIYVYIYADDSDLTVNGDLTINSSGGSSASEIYLNDDARLQVDGSLNYFSSEGGYGLIAHSNAGVPSTEIGVDLNVNFSGGTDPFYFWPDAGTVIVRRDLNLTNSGSGSLVHLDMDGGAIQIDRNFTGTLSGNNDLQIDADIASSITVGGNMELSLDGGNNIELHLGQNSTGSTARLDVSGNLLFDHNGGSLGGNQLQFLVGDDCVTTVGGNFTMDTDGSGSSGNFFTRLFDNAEIDVLGDVNLTNSIGSSYLEFTLNNSSRLEIGGNINRNASPNNFGILNSLDDSTIELDGTAAQVIAASAGAGTDGITYNNVVLTNTFSTAPQLTMEGVAEINGTLTFSDGVVQTTSSNYINFADGAANTGASSASFIDGPVRKTGDDAFIFPTGDGTNFLAIEMTAPSDVNDVFEAEYIDQNPNGTYSVSSLGSGIDHVGTTEYWEFNRVNGSSNVALTLNWNNASSVDNLSSLVLAGWDGSTWQSHGNGGTTGTISAGTIRSTGAIGTFNAFNLASSNTDNPLPIELTAFTAFLRNDHVELAWTTRTEINNEFFSIERSVDGIHFEVIETIQGAGNSNTTINYFTIDPSPKDGVSFYRLKQTDFNGDFSYSDIRRVFSEGNSDITIYPNPFFEEITISNLGDKEILENKLFSSLGKLIANFGSTQTINTSELPSGIYFLKSYDQNGEVLNTAKLVKR